MSHLVEILLMTIVLGMVKSSCYISDLSNVQLIRDEGKKIFEPYSEAFVECDKGYTPYDPWNIHGSLMCGDKGWETPFRCDPKPCTVPYIEGSDTDFSNKTVEHGQGLKWGCPAGSQKNQQKPVYCNLGQLVNKVHGSGTMNPKFTPVQPLKCVPKQYHYAVKRILEITNKKTATTKQEIIGIMLGSSYMYLGIALVLFVGVGVKWWRTPLP